MRKRTPSVSCLLCVVALAACDSGEITAAIPGECPPSSTLDDYFPMVEGDVWEFDYYEHIRQRSSSSKSTLTRTFTFEEVTCKAGVRSAKVIEHLVYPDSLSRAGKSFVFREEDGYVTFQYAGASAQWETVTTDRYKDIGGVDFEMPVEATLVLSPGRGITYIYWDNYFGTGNAVTQRWTRR